MRWFIPLVVAYGVVAAPLALADQRLRIPVILDTDIGGDIDDALALALVLSCPELELGGVTTVGRQAEDRAWIARRLLTHAGRPEIPVAFGRGAQPKYEIGGQIQYRRHPAVIFNRTGKLAQSPAVEFLYQQLKAAPGKLTLIAVGPLTNIARLLEKHPDCKPWIKRVVIMGGAVRVGYEHRPPAVPEWNFRHDVKAARSVLRSGVPLTVAPLDATAHLKLERPLRETIFAAATPLTFQVQTLYQLWGKPTPVLFDPLAVALAIDERFCQMSDLHLIVEDNGLVRAGRGKANARVAMGVDKQKFLDWFADRLASHGERSLPKPPGNRASLVPRGGLPLRVHAIEDYETDIEKRWWMSGLVETKTTPPGSRRACRGVLTQDFDGKQGDLKTAYTAVIFNPVPGPPMGKNTRLSFRYWLKGTSTLRVQLYSLSNGYHRYLSITGLPAEKWQSATVDMTQMRRPDGGGGSLAENERIDDIQFYADPRAELLIDDIVLYEAAPADEQRPFPGRVIFTGWFDTGRQGREWPGEFEIVKHQPPRTWKAARSLADPKTNVQRMIVNLRGRRPLASLTRVGFLSRLTKVGGDIRMVLRDSKTGWSREAILSNAPSGKWVRRRVDFTIAVKEGRELRFADEIHFHPPPGAVLYLDDLLVYQPGGEGRRGK